MSRSPFVLLALGLLAACGADEGAEMASEAETAPEATAMAEPEAAVYLTVEFPEAADGVADVTATMTVDGIRIVPAGDTTSGTGHHHLYLDTDLAPAGQPVPAIPGKVIHMGDGSSEYVFEGVPVGSHRMIAVVADGVHVPLQPWVVDTVDFEIR